MCSKCVQFHLACLLGCTATTGVATMDSLDISSCAAVIHRAQRLAMSRLLLQMAATVASTPTTPSAASPSGSGMSKSSLVYTFAFIGASVVVGLLFLGVIFKYVVKYRMWRAPVTTPLQPAQKLEDDYVSNIPNIKEVVVIRNPDGGASISIVREDEITDGRPPFLTYELMICKKAFAEFCQKQGCNGITSSPGMAHAASASDLAEMHAQHTTMTPQQSLLPDQVIPENGDRTLMFGPPSPSDIVCTSATLRLPI